MLAVPPPAPPPIVVVDRAGDSGTAPDIVKVRVTTGAKGRIAFIVVFATKFGSGSSFYVNIGSDYRLGPGGLEVWDPPANDFEPLGSESGTFSVAPGGRALEASVNVSELGNPKSFRFTVQSVDGDGGSGHTDTTPAATWHAAKG